MKKTVVAVLFGGVSPEHEVSCLSAASVLNNLDPERYTVLSVGITKDGRWFLYQGGTSRLKDGSWLGGELLPALLSTDRGNKGLWVQEHGSWHCLGVDVVFPVLHGPNGEDGTMQGLLEIAGLPYVGCGVRASANCMDKDTTKTLLCEQGIPVADWITVRKGELEEASFLASEVENSLSYPVFVKPANGGSSVGVTKVKEAGALAAAVEQAFCYDSKVIIERYMKGAEVESSVMGNQNPVVATYVGEIVPKREFYDYEGKYLDGSTDLYIPARIPQAQVYRLRQYAARAYAALGCEGLARVDFFAMPDGESVYLNELNTMPGFTDISMYPKLFIAQGMTYPEILDNLIALAFEKGGERHG